VTKKKAEAFAPAFVLYNDFVIYLKCRLKKRDGYDILDVCKEFDKTEFVEQSNLSKITIHGGIKMKRIQRRDLFGFFCYFLILFAFFCISIFIYPMLLDSEGYSGEHVGPNLNEIIKPMLVLIPIISSFIVATCSYFILRFKRFNKLVFPCIVIDATVLIFLLGVTLLGGAFLWLMFLIIPVSLILFILGIVLGWILDSKQKNI